MDNRDPETFAILGAAYEVRRHMSAGFQESVYANALAFEFGLRTIPFEAEPELAVHYKGQIVGCFKPDFVCYRGVIIEVKARPAITAADISQTLNYLTVSSAPKALVLNFGAARLEFKRLVGPSFRQIPP